MRLLFAAICCVALSTASFAQTAAPNGQQGMAPGNPAGAPDITPPAHPITVDQTRKMFELMNFQKTMDGMMNQMISMQNQQAPFIPQSVWDDFRSTFKQTDFVSLFLPVYQKYLSEEDAAKSIEFYQTPAGRRMLEAMPLMMADISSVAGQKGEEIGHSVVERHMPEIQAAAKKYQEEHAAPQPSGSAPTTPKPDSPR